MNQDYNKRNTIIAWGILSLALLPFLIAWITGSSNPFVYFAGDPWISFFGSYVAGSITIIGVAATLIYTSNQYRIDKKESVRPYIKYRQLLKIIDVDQTKEIDQFDYELAIKYFNSEEKESSNAIDIPQMEIYAELENVGLNTLVDLDLDNILIENRKVINKLNRCITLKVGDKTYLKVVLFNFIIEPTDFTDTYKNQLVEKEKKKVTNYTIKIKLSYSDLYSTKYSQVINLRAQNILKKTPDNEKVHHATYKSIESPILEKV